MTKKYVNRVKKIVNVWGIDNVKAAMKRNEFSELFDIRYATGTPVADFDNDVVKSIIAGM